MRLSEAMRKDDHDEVLELLLEGDEKELAAMRPLLWKINTVALLKTRQADRAMQVLSSRPEEDEDGAFFSAYALYLQGRYDETAAACRGGTETRVRLLRAQALARSEHFAESLEDFVVVLGDADLSAREEALIDCAYTLAMRLVAEGSAALDSRGRELLAMLLSLQGTAQGELGLNILRVVVEALALDDCPPLGDLRAAAEALVARLADSFALNSEGGETETDLSDRLAFLGLRMRVREPHETTSAELETLRQLLATPRGRSLDPQLRLELLAGMLRCVVAAGEAEKRAQLVDELCRQLDEACRVLPRTSRLHRQLTAQAGLAKAIAKLNAGRLAEARQLPRGDARLERSVPYLSLELSLAVHHRNPRELEHRAASALTDQAVSRRLNCARALILLAYYHRLNFQKKYAELLLDFSRKFFLEQLGLPGEKRLLEPRPFAQFARSVIAHVLRCEPVLRELREEFALCAQFVDEPELAAHVAEGCAARDDHGTAQRVYEVLLQRYPENTLFASRLNVIYSITAPERIDDALLPDFELITDANALRELENDYVRLLRGEEGAAATQPANGVEKPRAKKRRIRWPKNFNFADPGPRPDPERWLPKHERARFRRKTAKKGLSSRTQGASAVSGQTTEMFADPHSTASRATARTAGKKGR